MITTEENLILDMLLAKRGRITKVELSNKKETKKEYDQRMVKEVIENAIKCKASRAIKKNLRK